MRDDAEMGTIGEPFNASRPIGRFRMQLIIPSREGKVQLHLPYTETTIPLHLCNFFTLSLKDHVSAVRG